jgi:hypothetical protein
MIIALITAVAPSIALAGIVIEFKSHAYDPSLENATGTMYIDKDFGRVESKSGEIVHITIYRKDKTVLWEIDPDKWSYTEMTPKDADKMEGMMRDRVEMIERQLSSLSREERERIMQQHGAGIRMMKRMLEEKLAKNIEYKKEGTEEKIGDWTCDKYKEYYKDEFDDAEYWAVDFDSVGVSPDDFALCEEVEKEFGNFGGVLTSLANLWNKDVKAPLGGFPVRVLMFDEGTKMMRIDVTEIRREDVDPKLFELPKDFDKVPHQGME